MYNKSNTEKFNNLRDNDTFSHADAIFAMYRNFGNTFHMNLELRNILMNHLLMNINKFKISKSFKTTLSLQN